jgi:hypothetical protein
MQLAPIDDPLSYPGARATSAFHLRDGAVQPLVEPIPEGRIPVLAVGSNACPAQLAAKFRHRPGGHDVLGGVVTVGRLQVRPSAHLGRSGYWPFAPAALDETSSTAVLLFLDEGQVAVLDATEPNYVRTVLDVARHPMAGAPAGTPRGPVWIYVSKHGVVDDRRLPNWSDPPPTQQALLSALIPLLPVPQGLRDPASLSAALRTDTELAGHLTAALKERVLIRADGLATG